MQPLVFANLTLIGTTVASIADQAETIVTIPVAGVAPAGSTLVVEVVTADGINVTGDSFFIGSNPDGQTAPSYLAAADCGVSEPTDTASLGYPGMHIVMEVDGDEQSGVVFDSLCISYYTGAVSVPNAINGCPASTMAVSLPEAQPLTFCINRYTGAIASYVGRPCLASQLTHIVPDNGPLEVCQSSWTGNLRALPGGQQCLPSEIWGAIPAEA